MVDKRIEAQAVISAKDRTAGVFGRIAGKMRTMTRAAQANQKAVVASSRTATRVAAAQSRAASKHSKGVAAFGSSLKTLAGITAAYGGGRLVASSVKDFAELENKVVSLGITAEASKKQIADALRQFQQLAPQYGVPAGMISDAAEKYVAAGVDFQKAIAATQPTVMAAKAAGGEIGDLANAGIASMINLGIHVKDLAAAFDIMAKAGKEGNFELKDMARELPSVASRAKAMGLQGTEGLTKLVAMLEVLRKTSATGAEAANNLVNLFDKVVSETTIKNFKKFNVDLEKELKQGAKMGKDYIETLLEVVQRVTKGDAFKISKLFPDRQARVAMQTLLKFRSEYEGLVKTINSEAPGTLMRDLQQRMATTQSQMDQLSQSWNVLKQGLAEEVLIPWVLPLIKNLNKVIAGIRTIKEAMKTPKTGSDLVDRFGVPVGLGTQPNSAEIRRQRAVAELRRRIARQQALTHPDDIEDMYFGNAIAQKRAKNRSLFEKWTFKSVPQIGQTIEGIANIDRAFRRLAELQAMLAKINLPSMTRATGPAGRPRGYAPQRVPSGLSAFSLQGPALKATDIRSALDGLKAKVEQPVPVDVTGKVDLRGHADVNVRVKVEGPARVTGLSASGSAHIKPKVGTTMEGNPSQ